VAALTKLNASVTVGGAVVHSGVTVAMDDASGTVIVKAAQENANFVVSVLEPEAENGFVAFRVIEASRGAVLPVHRFF